MEELFDKYKFALFSPCNQKNYLITISLQEDIYYEFIENIETNNIENVKRIVTLSRDLLLRVLIERLIYDNLYLLRVTNESTDYLFSLKFNSSLFMFKIPFENYDYRIFCKISNMFYNHNIRMKIVIGYDFFTSIIIDITNEILFLIQLYKTKDEHGKSKILHKLKEVCENHDFSYEL